jgi:hypothetical protein
LTCGKKNAQFHLEKILRICELRMGRRQDFVVQKTCFESAIHSLTNRICQLESECNKLSIENVELRSNLEETKQLHRSDTYEGTKRKGTTGATSASSRQKLSTTMDEAIYQAIDDAKEHCKNNFGCILTDDTTPDRAVFLLIKCISDIAYYCMDEMRRDMQLIFDWANAALDPRLFNDSFSKRLKMHSSPSAFLDDHTMGSPDVVKKVAFLMSMRPDAKFFTDEYRRVGTKLKRKYGHCFPHESMRADISTVLSVTVDYINAMHEHLRRDESQLMFANAPPAEPKSIYEYWEETSDPETKSISSHVQEVLDRAAVEGETPNRRKMIESKDRDVHFAVHSNTVVSSDGARWRPTETARLVLTAEELLETVPPRRELEDGSLETPREYIRRARSSLTPHTRKSTMESVLVDPDASSFKTTEVRSLVNPQVTEKVRTLDINPLYEANDRVIVGDETCIVESVAANTEAGGNTYMYRVECPSGIKEMAEDSLKLSATSAPTPTIPTDDDPKVSYDFTLWGPTEETTKGRAPSEEFIEVVNTTSEFVEGSFVDAPGHIEKRDVFIRVSDDIAERMRQNDDIGPYKIGFTYFSPVKSTQTVRLHGHDT